MAIYSLNLGFISRSAGRSSVGFSAYISASRHKDERTGDVYNYSNKEEVVASRILAPKGAPDWALNAGTLWNHVEQFEDRIVGQRFRESPGDPEKTRKSFAYRDKLLGSACTAQTVMGALSVEFSQEQAEACVEEFINMRFVSKNLVVHYAIHWGQGNPHFHGLITRRPLLNGEFSKRKDREIVSKMEHNITRKAWEVVANKHLALAGFDVRIDCRSHKDRGSLFVAGVHEGYYAQRLAERGEYSRIVENNDLMRQRNIEIMVEHPESLIHEVSQKRTVFTRKHIEDEIIRRVGGDEILFAMLKARMEGIEQPEAFAPNENFDLELKSVAVRLTDRVLGDLEIASPVGENINRDAIFTSTAYKKQKEKMVELADELNKRSSKEIPESAITAAIKSREKELGFALSAEQQKAVRHLCTGPDIRILNGRAGTGKTTLLKAVADAYQSAGYNVLGSSFQGKAVEIMEREIGIPCKTLDSLKFSWERFDHQKTLVESKALWGKPYLYAFQKMKELEQQRFTEKDVILVDEANMIGGRLWKHFLEEAVSKGAKILIIQDTAQIKSRESGDYGRLFAQRFGTCETRDVVRQHAPWQKHGSALLNEGRILDGLLPYHEKGHLQWLESASEIRNTLVQAYLRNRQENPDQSRMVLAYRNRDVEALNQAIRESLKSSGALGQNFAIAGQEFAIGDKIRFTQNDHHGKRIKNNHDSLFQFIKEHINPRQPKGVKNGTFGTILSGDKRHLKIQLDDGRCIKLDPRQYPHLTHGYALGIHKSEGSTFDRTFVALDPLLDSSALLVAMTRHRHDVQAFVNRSEISDFKALVEKIGRDSLKETLHDYQVSEAQKPYLERVQQYRDLMIDSVTLREEMEGSLKPAESLYKHAAYPGYLAILSQKKEVAKTILENWEAHKPYVRLAGIRRDVLEVETGIRQRTLSDLEQRASIQAQGYMDLVRDTRQIWKTILETHPPIFAKQHAMYAKYQKQKAERDSLAAVFQENIKLHRPFLRVEEDPQTGAFKDYWGYLVESKDRFIALGIQQHAKAHLKSQHQKVFEERLSPGNQENYQMLKSYKEASVEAAALYQALRQPEKAFFLPPEMMEKQFRYTCSARDRLALQVTTSLGSHPSFFEKLKVQEDKLLAHATWGEVREKVQTYHSEKDVALRSKKAEALHELIHSPQKDNAKICMILKQEGLDFQRVRFDMLYAQKRNGGEVPRDVSPDYIFNHLRDYRQASQEIGRSWMANVRSQKPQAWEEALSARRASAQRLLHFEPAFVLFKAMNPDHVQKLEAHAQQIRTTQERLPEYKPFLKAEHVLEAAQGRVREIAEHLLGPSNPYLSARSTLRFGSQGKVNIHIGGEKEGLWHDFSTGIGGNIFQLVQQQKGLSFREAVDYCAWFLGVSAQEFAMKASHTRAPQTSLEEEKDRAARLTSVKDLHQKSHPIIGTVAETYLRQERHIKSELTDDLRYLPKGITFLYNDEDKTTRDDCFAAFGRNEKGELSSVQLTKLNDNGTRARSKDGKKLNKIQYGLAKGSFVTLQSYPQNSCVFIAEGVETALSLQETGIEGTIKASLGIHNMKNYTGPEPKIVLCADNDGPNARTHDVTCFIQEHLETQGKSITIIRPETAGQDFNDVLKEKGIEGVQKYIPHFPENQESLAELSAHLEKKLQEFKDDPSNADFKQDLLFKAKTLLKDPNLLEGLCTINPDTVKQMERLLHEQQKNRDMDLGR